MRVALLGSLGDSGPILSTVTWDPASLYQGTLSNGNRTYSTGLVGGGILSGQKTSGSWYAEVRYDSASGWDAIGFVGNVSSIGQLGQTDSSPEWGLAVGTGNARGLWHNGIVTNPGTDPGIDAYVVGDVVMLAVEMSTGKMWWGVNGGWLNSGAPMATASALNSNMKIAASCSFAGAGAFTIADVLTYSPPFGFSVL